MRSLRQADSSAEPNLDIAPAQLHELKVLYWDEFSEYTDKELAHIKDVHERTKAQNPHGIGTIWTPQYWPNDNGFYRWYQKFKAGEVSSKNKVTSERGAKTQASSEENI